MGQIFTNERFYIILMFMNDLFLLHLAYSLYCIYCI